MAPGRSGAEPAGMGGPSAGMIPATVLAGAVGALAGWVLGCGIRRLLGRLRRGARCRAGRCEAVLALVYAATGAAWAAGLVAIDRLPLLLGLGWLAVAAGAVDLAHRRLPDALTLPAIPVGLLLLLPMGAVAAGRGLLGAVVAMAGYGAVHLLAPHAMGAGDVKLAGSLGAALTAVSWPALAVAAVLAAALTTIVAALTAVVTVLTATGATEPGAEVADSARSPPGSGWSRARHRAVPHGPSMLVAGWLVVAAGAVADAALGAPVGG
jgi:leader peptidase (prepilin peptidase)/N-methyltransferase